MKFIDRARNVYSQYGEDGIIEAILEALPERNLWCVEFGAWDGIYLSNTRHLIESSGYSAVLIEPDPKSFRALLANTLAFPGVSCRRTFVGFDPSDSLDALLADTPCPVDFDVLSVDIDGNDIHVWRAAERYRPKLVCIEFNPTIPDGVLFEQPRDPKIKWGASLDAMKALAVKKKYTLVCVNENNAFFVADEWAHKSPGLSAKASDTRVSSIEPVMVFFGYDGTLLTSREFSVPWHRIAIAREWIQPLPAALRKYPLDYNWLDRFMLRGLMKIRAMLNLGVRRP